MLRMKTIDILTNALDAIAALLNVSLKVNLPRLSSKRNTHQKKKEKQMQEPVQDKHSGTTFTSLRATLLSSLIESHCFPQLTSAFAAWLWL